MPLEVVHHSSHASLIHASVSLCLFMRLCVCMCFHELTHDFKFLLFALPYKKKANINKSSAEWRFFNQINRKTKEIHE